jgi:UTP--glucose-1-phosphate uridylyltransferase
MLDAYAKHGGNIIAVEPVPEAEAHHYGVVSVGKAAGPVLPIDGMVEKPAPGTAPSNLTILGRYILQPEVFDILDDPETGAGGEIQITDAMKRLLKSQPFFALQYEGEAFDCGSKLGFLKANIAYALDRPELAEALRAELRKLV